MRSKQEVHILSGKFENLFCAAQMREQCKADLRLETEDPVECAQARLFCIFVHIVSDSDRQNKRKTGLPHLWESRFFFFLVKEFPNF